MLNDSMPKHKIIALCMAGINIEYQDTIMNYICEYANSFDYRVLIFSPFTDGYLKDNHDIGEMNIYNLINYNMIDGMILLSETIKNDTTLNNIVSRARQANVPIISIDKKIPYCYNICFNYENTMEEIVRHFVEFHGFTKINFIAGFQENSFSEERVDAYKKVLKEHNIPIEYERIGYGQFWSMPTYKVIDDFMKSELPLPEAIICANDTMAMAACTKLKEYGYKIPEDIKISGFDGIKEEQYHVPRLTTAKQDFKTASLLAVDKLKAIFEGKETPTEEIVYNKMIVSQSCGCVVPQFSDTNTVTHTLYMEIDELHEIEKNIIHINTTLSDGTNILDTITKMRKYILHEKYERMWLCAVEGIINSSDNFDNDIIENHYYSVGYSDNITAFIYKDHGAFIDLPEFKCSEILPNLENILEDEDSHNIKFSPMHYQDRAIGYIAINIKPPAFNFSSYYSLVMNLSNVIEVVKNHHQLTAIITKLEEMYIRDPLTGLFNRRGFYKSVAKCVNECIKEEKSLMVISIDLDGLKYINDVFGHSEGDNAIKIVSTGLSSVSVKNEICARFGGDEFVVAGVIDYKKDDYVKEYINKLAQYLEYYNKYSKKPYKIEVSCGVIVKEPRDDENIDEFIKVADNLMYEEKSKHKRTRANMEP